MTVEDPTQIDVGVLVKSNWEVVQAGVRALLEQLTQLLLEVTEGHLLELLSDLGLRPHGLPVP